MLQPPEYTTGQLPLPLPEAVNSGPVWRAAGAMAM